MATQLKKGTFEICLIALLSNKERYGYDLAQEINEIIPIKESTVYLILQRLEKTGVLESTVKVMDGTAKARKYYHATPIGIDYLKKLLDEWTMLEEVIKLCLEKGEFNYE